MLIRFKDENNITWLHASLFTKTFGKSKSYLSEYLYLYPDTNLVIKKDKHIYGRIDFFELKEDKEKLYLQELFFEVLQIYNDNELLLRKKLQTLLPNITPVAMIAHFKSLAFQNKENRKRYKHAFHQIIKEYEKGE